MSQKPVRGRSRIRQPEGAGARRIRDAAHLAAGESRGRPVRDDLAGGLFRVAVACEVLAIVLVLMALFWDAPLEGLADPMQTPNPAKAPVVFSGPSGTAALFPAGGGRRADPHAGGHRPDRHSVFQRQH